MKKTIIKTAIITALAVLVAFFATYFAIFIVSPKTIGTVYKNLGIKNGAVEMYERQYLEKGNSFNDLKELVDMAIYSENEAKIAEYGKILTIDQSVKLKDAEKSAGNSGAFGLYDYYATRTVEALYKTGNKEECVKTAYKTSDAFTANKSIYYVSAICLSGNDKDLAEQFVGIYDKGKYFGNITEGKSELSAAIFQTQSIYKI